MDYSLLGKEPIPGASAVGADVRYEESFDALQAPKDENGKRRRYGKNMVAASMNGGGAPIKLTTGNGRVSINKVDQ